VTESKAARRRGGVGSAAPYVPLDPTLDRLRQAAAGCRGCALYERATQTVFGEGPVRARIVLVGEQPGHDEDLAGHPFVGPAGRLLDQALSRAGLDRKGIYVTNVVKHFKWKPQGKRRIHERPNASEVEACRPWFQAELDLLEPTVLVCLGATAAQAVLGSRVRVTERRGRFVESSGQPRVFVTVHPSSLLRIPDDVERQAAMNRLVEELTLVARAADRGVPGGVA
jgi:DNA polymerase